MDKRGFLGTVAAGAALPFSVGAQPAPAAAGPALLTVTGAITATNRGPLDPVRDQMMAKQQLKFDKARAFDFTALTALPAVTLRPTLEYDKARHELRGPLLATVLQAAGATGKQLALRAIDGYSPEISVAEATRLRFIVATHLDGQPMALGGLGPLWAIYEPDAFPDIANKPLDQRFAQCPWGLFHVAVI